MRLGQSLAHRLERLLMKNEIDVSGKN